MPDLSPKSQFGFVRLPAAEKTSRVGEIFSSVADHYDLMNDFMSAGMHRLWKRQLVMLAAARPGQSWLDLACGSGDIARMLMSACLPGGQLTLADPSLQMLSLAQQRLAHAESAAFIQAYAERLPCADASFDGALCAFGLRNFTDQAAALAELKRVLKPGGKLLVLEFSRPHGFMRAAHRRYLLDGLPAIGKLVANDSASYSYLGESILAHPTQAELAELMRQAGFAFVQWMNLAGGIVAIHQARKATWS